MVISVAMLSAVTALQVRFLIFIIGRATGLSDRDYQFAVTPAESGWVGRIAGPTNLIDAPVLGRGVGGEEFVGSGRVSMSSATLSGPHRLALDLTDIYGTSLQLVLGLAIIILMLGVAWRQPFDALVAAFPRVAGWYLVALAGYIAASVWSAQLAVSSSPSLGSVVGAAGPVAPWSNLTIVVGIVVVASLYHVGMSQRDEIADTV